MIDFNDYRKNFREELNDIEDVDERLAATKAVARHIEKRPNLYPEEDVSWACMVLRNC